MTPPVSSAGDYAHTATKAAISAIPIVGGALTGAFDSLISSPLVKRRVAWEEDIAGAIEELQRSKCASVTFSSLQAADIIVRDLAIERKTVWDFFESVNDGLLFTQLRELKRSFRRQLLLIEGKGMRRSLETKTLMASTYELPQAGRFLCCTLWTALKQLGC